MITKTAEFPLACQEQSKFRILSADSLQKLCADHGTAVKLVDVKSKDDGEEWTLVPSTASGKGTVSGLVAIQSIESKTFLAINKADGFGKIHLVEENPEYWKILRMPQSNSIRIVTSGGDQQLALAAINDSQNESGPIFATTIDSFPGTENENFAWTLQFRSGELCHVSCPHVDKRLHCNVFGRISMAKAWGGREVWRFVEAGDGHVWISSWTHRQFYLSSTPDGHMTTSKNQDSWALWKVEPTAPDKQKGLFIRSVVHNRLLRFDGKDLSTTDPSDCGPAQIWHLEAPNRKIFYLAPCVALDKLLTCSPHPESPVVETKRNDKMEWEVDQQEEDGRITIRSKAHEPRLYLGSTETGEVTTSPGLKDGEWWIVEPSSQGAFQFLSEQSGRVLNCDKDGKLSTVIPHEHVDTGSCSWNLEPRMPDSLTGRQMAATAVVATGLAFAVAAPLAVTGFVAYLGFGQAGIVGGSTAAGMMSAEAVAAGGGVAAGGTVATLQSVGAAGLGTLGTSLACGGGAVVGTGISAATIAGTGVLKHEDSGNSTMVDEHEGQKNRPFCHWRTW